ncbi:MAG: hypothetical protein ACE149_17830 [Armatimonadota bacterium]
MRLIDRRSLAVTLDRVNDALFSGRAIPRSARSEAAAWIAGRQGLPGCYADMFAPTKQDFAGAHLFTGEAIASRAATAHVLGEEAMRALRLLGITSPAVIGALARAKDGMEARLGGGASQPVGLYCCGTCSCAYWRNLAAGGLDHGEARLAQGMKGLKARRLGTGRWRVFPFFYTVLALTEIELPGARAELHYAAPVLERYLQSATTGNLTSQRRHALAERALARC